MSEQVSAEPPALHWGEKVLLSYSALTIQGSQDVGACVPLIVSFRNKKEY